MLVAPRANDGSAATPAAVPARDRAPATTSSRRRPSRPPVFTHWSHGQAVRPAHARTSSGPPPPPALTSAQVRRGASTRSRRSAPPTGSTRTPDQTQIGLFWNPPIWAAWNRIAQTVAVAHHARPVAGRAHVRARSNLTFADSVIAFYDAKYTYRLWRPVTAVRAADSDGNPATVGDPNWTPLANTALDPAPYPGAHSVVSAAGAAVLTARSSAATATASPSPVPRCCRACKRSFTSFTGAAERGRPEPDLRRATLTRVDEVAGENLGHAVANVVVDRDVPKFAVPIKATRDSGTH